MSEIQNAFTMEFKHKRKRSENDVNGIAERVLKRPTPLAIRSPPQSRPFSLFSNLSNYSPFTGQLTPVDTSEDESVTHEDIWSSNQHDLGHSDPSESTTSIQVQVSSPQSQYDPNLLQNRTEVPPSTPTLPRIGRARSNDLLSSPPKQLTPSREMLAPLNDIPFPHDRVPTPILSHFDSRGHHPWAPRHNFTPIHTNLSPMMEQDTWGSLNSATPNSFARHNLPSPAEDGPMCSSRGGSPTLDDQDAEMLDDLTTSSFSSLKVSGEEEREVDMVDTPYSQSRSQVRVPELSGNRTTQPERVGRVHMGYMSTCEKCVRGEAGHRMHVLYNR